MTPEVERLRARVLESLRARQQQHVAATSDSPKPAPAAPTPGTMKDRTGELSRETMHVINHEFMPLVDVCFDQARERNPRLRGMLALNVELAGAVDVGGSIIETLDPAENINEVHDDELVECVRQSAFSIELPAPVKNGRVPLQLTIPLDDPKPRDAGP